jgi:hypothetical protein
MPIKNITLGLFAFIFIASISSATAQLKSYQLNPQGDTINAINKEDQKVGKWVIEVGELRGEPGYVEEGMYKKGEKHGFWRKYSSQGDLLAVENYILGGKDGLQQYFNFLGDLEREENWRGYNPDAPYDTIAVYGTGSGEIVDYKLVKAAPYSIKHGEWRFYEPGTGRLLRKEQWSNNNLVNPNAPKTAAKTYVKPDKVEKTPDMLEWERKNRRKKVVDGRTGL